MDQVSTVKRINDLLIWPGAMLASGLLLLIIAVRSGFRFDDFPDTFDQIVREKNMLYHAALLTTILNILIYREVLNVIFL